MPRTLKAKPSSSDTIIYKDYVDALDRVLNKSESDIRKLVLDEARGDPPLELSLISAALSLLLWDAEMIPAEILEIQVLTEEERLHPDRKLKDSPLFNYFNAFDPNSLTEERVSRVLPYLQHPRVLSLQKIPVTEDSILRDIAQLILCAIRVKAASLDEI